MARDISAPPSTHELISKNQIPGLDALRGFAVLLVILSHVSSFHDVFGFKQFYQYLPPGALGVDLFFALSGFLITRILLVDRARHLPLRNFFIRRSLRIFPIYYLLLVLVWIIHPEPIIKWCAFYLTDVYFSYGQGQVNDLLGHTWSLSVEEHFYLLWPLLVYFFHPRVSRTLAAYVIIPGSLLLGLLVCIIHPAPGFLYFNTLTRGGTLAAGSLLAFFEPQIYKHRRHCQYFSFVLCVIGLNIAAAGGSINAAHYAWTVLLQIIGFMISGVSMVLLVISRPPRKNFHTPSWLRDIGKISYGLYLYHVPYFVLFGVSITAVPLGYRIPVAIGLPVALIFTFVSAALSFQLIERPILSLKRFFPS